MRRTNTVIITKDISDFLSIALIQPKAGSRSFLVIIEIRVISLKTQVHPMLAECWASVAEGGITLQQY